VTESIDRSLADKEIWFVATGAEESGTWGMRHFLEVHAADLRGASIINIDNIGSGNLHWVTEEGMVRRYRSDRRLIGAAKRVAREKGMAIRSRPYKGLSTDATPALARGYRAMSMMAFDINGRLPNWHWSSDTTDNVDVENIDTCVDFVAGIIREL
jgi:Zn-dependent M28 family amino/carboxypeptidase